VVVPSFHVMRECFDRHARGNFDFDEGGVMPRGNPRAASEMDRRPLRTQDSKEDERLSRSSLTGPHGHERPGLITSPVEQVTRESNGLHRGRLHFVRQGEE
jgi:hypothetical protein